MRRLSLFACASYEDIELKQLPRSSEPLSRQGRGRNYVTFESPKTVLLEHDQLLKVVCQQIIRIQNRTLDKKLTPEFQRVKESKIRVLNACAEALQDRAFSPAKMKTLDLLIEREKQLVNNYAVSDGFFPGTTTNKLVEKVMNFLQSPNEPSIPDRNEDVNMRRPV